MALLVTLDKPVGIAAVLVDNAELIAPAAFGAAVIVGKAQEAVAAMNAEGVGTMADSRSRQLSHHHQRQGDKNDQPFGAEDPERAEIAGVEQDANDNRGKEQRRGDGQEPAPAKILQRLAPLGSQNGTFASRSLGRSCGVACTSGGTTEWL